MSVDITMWVCVRWILAFVPMQVLSCESVYLNTGLLPIYLQVLWESVYVKYWLLSVNFTRVVVWIWVRWILSFGAIFTSVVVWMYASLILAFVAVFTSVVLWICVRWLQAFVRIFTIVVVQICASILSFVAMFTNAVVWMCVRWILAFVAIFASTVWMCVRGYWFLFVYIYNCCHVSVCTLTTGFCRYMQLKYWRQKYR